MRLNLGCGKRYKEGFINIDAFDATVADALMSVEDLAFPSNSVDAIEACQLIEHLGYIHTISALAEWFRVLKPGGTLLIETPDLESSLEQYLHGDHDAKKQLLTWLYGVESPGMEHQLCYPKVLIKQLLKKSGFTRIATSCFTTEKYRPVMRISSKKPQDYTVFQIIAQSRKTLVKHRLIDFNDNPLALEQEHLLDFFLINLQEYLKKNDKRILERIMVEGCIKSVPMTHVFFQECHRQKVIPTQTAKRYSEVLQFLSSVHFTDLLLLLLKEMPTAAGTQKKTMTMVTTFGKQSIKGILSNTTDIETEKNALVTLSKKYSHDDHVVFSETLLEYQAADLCYRAIKDFVTKDFASASAKLHEAIRLDRNHLLYFWNLGRVLMLTNNTSEAQQCYKDALTLARLAPIRQKGDLETALKKERDHFSPTNHGAPVLDVKL